MLTDWIRPLLNFTSQHGRRAHAVNGRAHVELRAMTAREHEALRARLAADLFLREGVLRVDVNAVVGRVIVAFDEARCELRDIVRIVDRAERDLGLDAAPFPLERPEHPGDLEPLVRCAIELGGDVVGLGMAAVGRLVRLPTLPIELDAMAVLSLFDAPRLRAAVESYLGRQTTAFALTMANAVTQGLAQSTVGLAVDLSYHGLVFGERLARRWAWAEREAELCADRPGVAPLTGVESRPAPLPDGPIERYADAAVLAAGGAFAVAVGLTGSVVAATGPLLSGIPKPARLGREAFASALALVLARRGALPLDRRALRRLDRVDCLVVPLELLVATDVLPGSVVHTATIDGATVRDRIAALFDPCLPAAQRREGPWSLVPLAGGSDTTGYRLLALRHGDTIVGAARVQAGVEPAAAALLDTARAAGMRIVVAARHGEVPPALAADEVVPGETSLTAEVRRLQRAGRVVCVVSSSDAVALDAADCGIGIHRAGDPAPWTADVLCGASLDDARLVVDACRSARTASQQSAELAGIAAGVGVLIALPGLGRLATERAALAANVSSLIAMANGARHGASLALAPSSVRRNEPAWHALDVGEVLARLGTSPQGLDGAEAERRRIVPEAPPTVLDRLASAAVEQLQNPLTPLLAAGAGLAAVAGSVVDAVLVGGVVTLNATIGGVQRLLADRAIGSLADDTRRPVRVRRNGEECTVDDDALVPGDVVLLHAGDAVPADCRLIESDHLEVDESSLTGESLPVTKAVRASRAAAVADRASMVYAGSSVAAGTATGVVVAAGNATEVRRAGREAAGRVRRDGVEARLESITDVILPAAVLGGAAVAAAGLLRGRPASEVLATGTSLAVAAVPEGLPVLALAAQLAAARRLSERGALVRNPRSIEAIGRVDVVCFDKTGTVTEGRLRLRSVWRDGREALVDGLDAATGATIAAALRATPARSDGTAHPHPTDGAIADGAAAAGVDVERDVAGWRRLAELPFEPARGYHATLGRVGDELRLSVKGAPETVIDRCSTTSTHDGTATAMSADDRRRFAAEAARLAGRGLRVLAVAERVMPLDAVFDASSVERLQFGGFVTLSDPVRASAGGALRGLAAAGVRAVLISGDHPSTATRVADELGILAGGGVMTGPEIDDLDDDALAARLPDTVVFARVSPVHKVRLVTALQRAGHTVAMTGDGANDAPAIRMADVGIALGRNGTPAALDAADLVVTDDRIETLVDAVLEGRAMWVSVRDAVAVLVGGNLAELAFTVTAGLVGEMPLNPRQLLLVNLLTDVAPAMVIATRPPPATTAAALLREGPEASLAAPLTADIAWRGVTTAAAGAVAWAATRARGARAQAGTVALVALVGSQIGQTLATAGRSPVVIATGLGSFAALATIVQTPGLSGVCGCTPLGVLGWTTALGAATASSAAATIVPRLWPGSHQWAERQIVAVRGALEHGVARMPAWPEAWWPRPATTP